MVHVRFEGRSFDSTEGQLGVQPRASEQELKERLARRFDVNLESFRPHVVDRTERGDTIVRPEDELRGTRFLAPCVRGGTVRLREFHDRGEYWQVEWTADSGYVHTSAIEKRDLTVISAGICLSGLDRDFAVRPFRLD